MIRAGQGYAEDQDIELYSRRDWKTLKDRQEKELYRKK